MAEHSPEGLMEADTALRRVLGEMSPLVVAFSGGVDSALLAWMARDALGSEGMLAVTAVSASLADRERAEAESFALTWDIPWSSVGTSELADPRYVGNGPDRCARCRDALMDVLEPIATARGATVVLGVNVDDLGDYRPGQQAAAARGARFPLVEAGFTKGMVRSLARKMGLSVWEKPAAPCLASRIPYGTPVTLERLHRVSEAESALRALGFRSSRVRHYGDTARLELPVEDLRRAVGMRREIVQAVRSAGYEYVTLDMEGLRSGNLNSALGQPVSIPGS